jgi:bacterioferritin-associated ferredoxin
LIVCHCHAVSDRDIRRAARDGALSVQDVARDCGAASGCGGCAAAVRELLDEVHGPSYTQLSVVTPAPVAPQPSFS